MTKRRRGDEEFTDTELHERDNMQFCQRIEGKANGRMNQCKSAQWMNGYKGGGGDQQQRSDFKEKDSGGER